MESEKGQGITEQDWQSTMVHYASQDYRRGYKMGYSRGYAAGHATAMHGPFSPDALAASIGQPDEEDDPERRPLSRMRVRATHPSQTMVRP